MTKTTNDGQVASDHALLLAKLLAPGTPSLQRQHAFGQIVTRFQDMAYGYAYSLLGDPDLAEEAAQEAFLAAWKNLAQLQHSQAFPAWFKRIVYTQCCALGRRKQVNTVSWDGFLTGEVREQAGAENALLDPQIDLEQSERRTEIWQAVAGLPAGERAVVALFYINEYSREEIAGFLGITPLAVKKRLASARRRLKERIIHMVQDDLHDQRPSRDGAFTERVLAFSRQFGDLLRSGTPILETLARCAAAQKENSRLQQAIGEMEQQVQTGDRLGVVMDRYPDLFSEGYRKAISQGEDDGSLDTVLARLATGNA